MRTIGIRAHPKEVTFAIYEADTKTVLNVEPIRIPNAFGRADALKYVRNMILDVLREYDVTKAGIRLQEPVAQQLSISRTEIEGVIQEAFASSNVSSFYAGPIASVATKLNVDRAEVKPMIDGRNTLTIPEWEKLSKAQREAVLFAIGALNA